MNKWDDTWDMTMITLRREKGMAIYQKMIAMERTQTQMEIPFVSVIQETYLNELQCGHL